MPARLKRHGEQLCLLTLPMKSAETCWITKELFALEAVAQLTASVTAFSVSLGEFGMGNEPMLLVAGVSLLIFLHSFRRAQTALDAL